MKVITFRYSERLKHDMYRTLAREGITARRVSRWICEQIRALFAEDPHLLIVGAGDGLEKHSAVFLLRADDETADLIERGFAILRAQDPRYEGVQAAVIRAAIRRGVRMTG